MKEESLEKFDASWATLRTVSGIIVAGGFGNRGIEGKILAAQYARENKKPYLGICLGMQIAVIEYCRNVLVSLHRKFVACLILSFFQGQASANSEEFDAKTAFPAVIFMPEVNPCIMGGTMRLGSRKTIIKSKNPGESYCLLPRRLSKLFLL